MAVVWRAFDRRLGREVAVKVLSATLATDGRFRQRFENEARHIAALTHPNIVVIHDFGDADGMYIVMELIRGRSLRQILTESSSLSGTAVADLAVDVLSGLGHAHDAGILHRDIKPGNILVTDSGIAKIADFGIAKSTENTVDLTEIGAIVGTISYASPEQLSGEPVGPASDLYSLACVMYECLAGRPPFVAGSIAGLVSQQRFTTPSPLSRVSPNIAKSVTDTVMRALEKSPTDRFASAREMRRALGTIRSRAGDLPITDKAPLRARTATVTVLFCEFAGFGDDRADEVRGQLFATLRALVEDSNGELVKTFGDGVMAVFARSALDALYCANEMTKAAPAVAPGLSVRVGISHGEVTSEEGDWFGSPVVEAARLQSEAKPGTVLAAALIRTIVGSRARFTFDAVAPLELKGIPGLFSAYQVREATQGAAGGDHPAVADRRSGRSVRQTLRRASLWRPGRRRLFLALLIIALLSVGLTYISVHLSVHLRSAPANAAVRTQTDLGYTPRYVSIQCPPDAQSGPGAICGELTVPQDRTHPKARQVHLLVVRAAAETAKSGATPIVDLGDGEGPASTTRLYSNYISLSVRGGQGSVPELTCPELETSAENSLALVAGSVQVTTARESALTTCREQLQAEGVDPNDYGLDAAAADVRDLLKVLGVRQANLLAFDEAMSLLAFDIMRQYPQLVRSVSIEDGVPPGYSEEDASVANFNGALISYAALCAKDSLCHSAFPDVRGQVARGVLTLNNSPMIVSTSTPHSLAVLVDGRGAVQALFEGLTSNTFLPSIASLIYKPVPTLLAPAIVQYRIGDGNNDWGLGLSIFCKDVLPGLPSYRHAEDEASILAYPELAGVAESSMANRDCQEWNVQPDDSSDSTPIVSSIPTLLFGGALNPESSPTWAAQIALGLAHVQTITFPTLTVGALQEGAAPPCLSALRLRFLHDPYSSLPVTSCEDQSPRIIFTGTGS